MRKQIRGARDANPAKTSASTSKLMTELVAVAKLTQVGVQGIATAATSPKGINFERSGRER